MKKKKGCMENDPKKLRESPDCMWTTPDNQSFTVCSTDINYKAAAIKSLLITIGLTSLHFDLFSANEASGILN